MNTDPVDNQGTPQPTTGRIVRYVTQDGQERAAGVVDVHPGTDNLLVNLHVWETHGIMPQTSIPFGGPDKPGTWFWPERG